MQDHIIAVIADTHIPDRVKNLHPRLIPFLKELGVHQILHAGDLCSASVLNALRDVAPLTAVRGNRDIFVKAKLPAYEEVVINGVSIGLSHGHGNLWTYFLEKLHAIFHGYRLETFLPLLVKKFPQAKVIVFGHTHFPENVWIGGRLFLNPGSLGIGRNHFAPSFAILKIDPMGHISSDIIYFKTAVFEKRKWVEY